MSTPYDITGFGDYLADPGLPAKYHEQLHQLGETNWALAELPRFVAIWRADSDSGQRGQWSARQVESWIQVNGGDSHDLEDFQLLAGAFFRERSS